MNWLNAPLHGKHTVSQAWPVNLFKIKDAFTDFQRLVILSPHPDDVAYSLGGCVHLLPQHLNWTILTVFSRSVYAPGFPHLTSELDISHIRGEEEDRFASSIGARWVRLHFADASVMGHSAESEINDNFADERFEAVCLTIDEVLTQLLPDLILTPLALGRHIDHRIVFEAIRRSSWSHHATVLYYEDLPYVGFLSESDLLSQVTARLGKNATPMVVDITEIIAKKCDALLYYPSQESAKDESVIKNYAISVFPEEVSYAERLWCSES